MDKQDIYILGIGNNTPVYIDLLEECGYNIAGLYHYEEGRTGEKVLNCSIVGTNEELFQKSSLEGFSFAISVGDNEIRAKLSRQIREKGGHIPTIIHPKAEVSRYAKLGEGVVVHAGAIVQATALIGQDTVLSYNTSVSHTSVIGANCYVAFGSTIGAYVKVMDYVLIGQASVIVSGCVDQIGSNAIIGAGAVVVKSVEANTIVKGNPAK